MEQFSAFADSSFDSGAFCEGWKKFREKWKNFARRAIPTVK